MRTLSTILVVACIFAATIVNAQPAGTQSENNDVLLIMEMQEHLKKIIVLKDKYETLTRETEQMIINVEILESMGYAGVKGLLHICKSQAPELSSELVKTINLVIKEAKATYKLQLQLENMDTFTGRAFMQTLGSNSMRKLIKEMKKTRRKIKEARVDIMGGCEKIIAGAGGQ